ncbi:MAG: excisionase, partial [Clostridiales bacterium]|nr:excisionase [Clostridiales bacterium]
MFYTLMHKNNPVAEMEIDSASGYIAKLRDVFDPRRLPVGVGIDKSVIDRKALNDWWMGRSIPASRAGLNDALMSIGVNSPTLLLEKCYGLSLS